MRSQQEAELAQLEAAQQTKRAQTQAAQLQMKQHLDQQVHATLSHVLQAPPLA